jgi:hypothetical protein
VLLAERLVLPVTHHYRLVQLPVLHLLLLVLAHLQLQQLHLLQQHATLSLVLFFPHRQLSL